MQRSNKTLGELLASPKEVRRAVEFAAACGAATTLKKGAIAAQPTLKQVEQLVSQRKATPSES